MADEKNIYIITGRVGRTAAISVYCAEPSSGSLNLHRIQWRFTIKTCVILQDKPNPDMSTRKWAIQAMQLMSSQALPCLQRSVMLISYNLFFSLRRKDNYLLKFNLSITKINELL